MLHGQNQDIVFLVGFVFENTTRYMRNFEQLLDPNRVVKEIFIEQVKMANKTAFGSSKRAVAENKHGVIFRNAPAANKRSSLDDGYWFTHDLAVLHGKLAAYQGNSLRGRTDYVKEKLLEQKLTYQYKELAETLNELNNIPGNDCLIEEIVNHFNRTFPDYKVEYVDWEENEKPHFEIIDM